MRQGPDALERSLTAVWRWMKQHWGVSILAPWLSLAGVLFADGDYYPAVGALAVGTASYYTLAKVEAIERADKQAERNTTKG